ncbi:hypothetical protein R3W88_011285 [Solanum pinnatisectum]|uniref:Uncharacterized protein n=1 Tax=Solanum pinnatisectum TaxID=50273 RepID=A0AAV9L6U3_9SOLN|nr:hypothetical protein R3W88_011285 [Solanum pinnatisectum]
MENNRKRGRETLNRIYNRKKQQVMMMNEDDDFDENRYKWDNAKDFMRTEECHEDDESGTSTGPGAETTGVFDFPWIKGNKDVNFKEEIEECLDSTFAVPTTTTTSYNCYDDEIRIDATTITTTTPTILCDQKKLLLGLDIDLDFNLNPDLIDHFFTDVVQSSCDVDQLKVNEIEDQQLKIEVNDDQKLVEPKDGS